MHLQNSTGSAKKLFNKVDFEAKCYKKKWKNKKNRDEN